MHAVCVGEIVTNATFHILCPWTVSTTCFALVKINKAEFTKSSSTMICKILLYSHLKSIFSIFYDLVDIKDIYALDVKSP